MKKIILIVLAIIVFFAMGTKAGYGDKTIEVDGLKIQGPAQFREDIVEGLDLLRDKAPEYYDMVVGNLVKVYYDKDGYYNGMYTDCSYSMAGWAYKEYIEHEHLKVYYMALTLVHEAVHAKRWKQGVDTGNRDTEEWFAIETEKVVAKLIEAPEVILNWSNTKYETKYWEKQSN